MIMAIAGNVLHDRGYLPHSSGTQFAAASSSFALLLAFGFSCIPTMLKFFLAGQIAIGDGNVTIVRAIAASPDQRRDRRLVLHFFGLTVALPAAIHDCFFDDSRPAGASACR